jgi:hypothetical protein
MGKSRSIRSTPFRDLCVSPQDRSELLVFSNSFVETSFRKYERFVAVDGRAIRDGQWKHVKSRGDLHIYVARHASSHSASDANLAASRAYTNVSDGGFPELLSVGQVPGQLDDLMLGITSPTIDMVRVRAAYVGPDLENSRLLASIVAPTRKDPFRCVTVKWLALDRRGSAKLFKNRDAVLLEATGVLKFANGERIGYHAMHSIEFPETRKTGHRHEGVRARIAHCAFYRQCSVDRIEVFGSATVDVGGRDLPRVLVVPGAAEILLNAVKNVNCGLMKKIANTLTKLPDVPRCAGPIACVTCGRVRATSGVLGMLADRRKSVCRLCFGVVCSGCRMREKMAFFTPDNELVLSKLSFCTRCVAAHELEDPLEAATAQATTGSVGHRSFAFSTLSAASTSRPSDD